MLLCLIGDSMNDLDVINSSILSNKNLTQDVKEDIFELIVIFNNSFPSVSLDNFNNRIKTLKIEKTSKFDKSYISYYDFRKNILFFNNQEINKDYDAKHAMMFELLNIITANDLQVGFNTDNRFVALNAGFTEIITNYLVGNSGGKLMYADEAVMTNIITTLVGFDNMLQAYFNNDSKFLLNCMVKAGVKI